MSIEILIKNKLFSRKTMPLEVILGEELAYGKYKAGKLYTDVPPEGELLVYHPDHIGRGFTVSWTPQEHKRMELRLPQPCHLAETADFYGVIRRIMTHWGGTLMVEGRRTSLDEFLAGQDDMEMFNNRVIRQFAGEVLAGKHETLTIYSAKLPLVFGTEEAAAFEKDPATFSAWLHDRQSVEAEYNPANFYQDEDGGIFGVYSLWDGEPFILEKEPTVPFGLMDPATGRGLECHDYRVMVGLVDAEEPLGRMGYAELLERLPIEKVTPFDANKILVEALTKEEIRQIALEQA